MTHTCSVEECGYSCWLENGEPVRFVTVNYGDAGSVDGEGPCGCEGHDFS